MPNSDGKSRIILISNNPLIIDSVENTIKGENDLDLLDRAGLVEGIEPTIAKLQPDLILLDFEFENEKSYDLIDNIATRFPSVAVVAILPESKVQFSDRVILSGARAFILYPFTEKNLLVTVRRVLELLHRNFPTLTQSDYSAAKPIKPKNTFTVFSPKGGSGCTTVAVNMAIALRQLLKEPVLLVDGKHLFGHVALMLNLRTANSITDLISHAGMLDQHLINQVVVEHVSGLKVLPSPLAVAEAQGIRPDELYKVVEELQAVFPIIIVDGGNNLNENAVTYMDASDKVILVINPNLAAVRDARQFIEVCQSLSYPMEKIMLVLNNTGHKADIRQEEIEKILKLKVTCSIPGDENQVLNGINEGVPLILKNSRLPVAKAIQSLAETVRTQINAANAAYLSNEKKANSELLNKSSRLG